MSYSKDYKKRTIEYRQEGHTLKETHKTFKVWTSTIQRWEKRLKETGDLEKKEFHRSFRKIDPEKLKKYVKEHPDAYQSEMAEVFGCSESGIWYALKRYGITRKKKTTRYQEQNQEKVAAYKEQIKDIPAEKIAYVDECGIDTYLYREYGYSPRGQQIFGRISGRKYQRCGIVAAKMGNEILAPFEYSGTMDSSLFEFWFSNQLLPSLNKGTVIVMDNASFHSKKRLFSVTQNAGCILLFLPPYSPELNPIEKFWAYLKRFLRKILPSFSSFDDALFTAFQLC